MTPETLHGTSSCRPCSYERVVETGEFEAVKGAQLLKYPAAILFASVALLARWALDPWLGDSQPLSLLFGAVALAVWYGGPGPALLAAAIGYAASDYLFIPPRGVFALVDIQETISLVTYLVSCAIIIGFGHGMRVANQRARQYAQRLEENQSQLKLAERRKDEFLATLAHELRNPLAPIRNAVSLLIPRNPELNMARDIIDRQSRHLTRLVEDLLDMSRVRAGRIRVQKEAVDLGIVLRQAIESSRPQIEAAGHELDADIPQQPIHLDGDSTRLVQVFANLLNNAARYTPHGGHIHLAVHHERESVRVSVRDDGIGIPHEVLPRVFEMFLQGDRPAERTAAGLGIGLALVQKLVELHSGHVEAKSDGDNKGSEFIVQLPVRAATPKPFALAADPYPMPPAPARETCSILIIESGLNAAESFAAPLSAMGCEVHLAHSESEAVRVGARVGPRAIVVDLRRSDAPDVAFCRQLRRYPWGQRALIVGLIGQGGERQAEASLDGVLDGYSCDLHAAIRIILDRLPTGVHPPHLASPATTAPTAKEA
jgi:signal transduction histidine kinase/CheY-like chemotaxis protein